MPGYVPHTEKDRASMLSAIGVGSTEEFFRGIPDRVRFSGKLNLPEPLSELEAVKLLEGLSEANAHSGCLLCFAGAGAYDHFIPSVVGHVTSRSEFYTAYTPYQPEVSQAVLQSIYEYQSLICQLTGMDVGNASMYDGATGVAEAALMAVSTTRRRKVVVSRSVNPEYREVLTTYANAVEIPVKVVTLASGLTDLQALAEAVDDETACVIIQHPNFFGALEDVEEASRLAHEAGALFAVAVDPISLGLLKPPGDYGADIVVGEGQGLGNPMSYGGPYLGFFAAREQLVRRMPGRIVGATVDNRGQRGFVLTLQTREQHIRRERATSNICSNEALNALAATVYLATMGAQGIRDVASLCLRKAHYAMDTMTSVNGFRPLFPGTTFFKEFAVECPGEPSSTVDALLDRGILAGVDLGRWYPEYGRGLLIAVTEKRTRSEIDRLAAELEGLS